MPGNEVEVVRRLISLKNQLELPKIGLLTSVGSPGPGGVRFELSSVQSLSSDDSSKKADIYLNNFGVSIKQQGSAFLFNRLQRANVLSVLDRLGISEGMTSLAKLDLVVRSYHDGLLPTRNIHWTEGFTEGNFKKLLRFLMMVGSPNTGFSEHPADLIMVADVEHFPGEFQLFSFEEYFEAFEGSIYLTIRRQWLGQASQSEHARARSLAAKAGNAPWVFESIVGEPRSGWQDASSFPPSERRTVYMIFLELIH